MADNHYSGRHGRIYHGVTGADVAAASTILTDWTMSTPKEFSESTCQGDTNKRYTAGLPDAQGTLAGYWDSTIDTAYDAADLSVPVNAYFYPSTLVTTAYWYGMIWISVDQTTVGVNAGTTAFTGKWAAQGSLTRKPA